MKAVYDPGHAAHDPAFFLVRGTQQRSTELPERAERLLDGLKAGAHDIVAPTEHGLAPVAAIHPPHYLAWLETAHAEWSSLPGASPEIIPNVHPSRVPGTYPDGAVGRAGWHMADTACPIGAGTYEAARLGADVALTAADLVIGGERAAYALCRPPGHHCYADMAGGFCFLNNSAIAAQELRKNHDRVVILDVDVHHGNGTQGIFYDRGDVMTISIHGDPNHFYPWFWGYAHERGQGAGEGANLNLPLAHGSGDREMLGALDEIADVIDAFAPGAMVLALGLDAAADDPLGVFEVSTPGFEAVGARIARYGLPTVIVQEGGYLCDALGPNLTATLGGFEAGL